MPWIISGEHDNVFSDIEVGVVVTRDRDAYAQTPVQQFGFQPDDSHNFMRAEFNVGRRFAHLIQHHATLPARLWESDVLCDRFKTILEALEPGKHRFVPYDLRQPDMVTPWPEQYWFWRCENFVDAIVPGVGDGDPRRSGGLTWNADASALASAEGNPCMDGDPVWHQQHVLSAAAIAGSHAWRDNGFLFKHSIRHLFLSDECVDRLKAVDAVGGLYLRKLPVSDLPASRHAIPGTLTKREATLARLRKIRRPHTDGAHDPD